MSDRRILVTAALPYANGSIHIGHLVEYIYPDIWVRFQKLRGNRCIYLCADDTHGTAIMLRAKREGVSEEEFIARAHAEHLRDLGGFDIAFDNYGSTNSEQNRRLCEEIWAALRQEGLIVEREVTQLYDPVAETFLADRFVKGTCPVCGLPDQYGDNCDNGHTYTPADLNDPVSVLSGTTPEPRSALHLFVQIEQYHEFLEKWTQSGTLQPEVANYLAGQFLGDRLRDWDVSRPAPYFGFEIPDSPGNYWYVWFDAPIGYMASTAEWCEQNGENFNDWWRNPETEIHHFIGRDITYFHCLFWPAMLEAARYQIPTGVHIHGFLTVDGEKMSKSKGTFVSAATYLNHLDPAYIRYYFASKLTPRWDDFDLNLEDFANKVNSDLVGKVINLASRTAKFISGQKLCETYPVDGGLFAAAAERAETIAAAYDRCDYNLAIREIIQLADAANRYVEEAAPWVLRKDPSRAEALRAACSVSLNLFRQIVIYLTPVLPRLAAQTGDLLGVPIQHWDEVKTPLTGTPVSKFQHMLQRVDPVKVQAMIEESKSPESDEATTKEPSNSLGQYLEAEPLEAECTINDFAKVDLRVAEVIAADHVKGADKLLQLTLSLGGEERRNVFAGIKSAYDPESLVGRKVICVANLAPRKMRFGTSEGMVCAAGAGGAEVFLLSADDGAQPGMRVH